MFNDKYSLTEAVLSGRKTQTRRIIKGVDGLEFLGWGSESGKAMFGEDRDYITHWIKPQYEIGEVVAIKQSYRDVYEYYQSIDGKKGVNIPLRYYQKLTKDNNNAGWNNKMFVSNDLMPHQIRITDVRVERLQDISDEDCLSEGVEKLDWRDGYKHYCPMWRFDKESLKEGAPYCATAKASFSTLIDKVSGKGTWESNPYVFAYEFELIK